MFRRKAEEGGTQTLERGKVDGSGPVDDECGDPDLPTESQVVGMLTSPLKAVALAADSSDPESVAKVLQQLFLDRADQLQDLVFETVRLLAEIHARTGWDDLKIIRAVGCRQRITDSTADTIDEAKLELLNRHLSALLFVAEDAFDSCGDSEVVGAVLSHPEVLRLVCDLQTDSALDAVRIQPELLLHQPFE